MVTPVSAVPRSAVPGSAVPGSAGSAPAALAQTPPDPVPKASAPSQPVALHSNPVPSIDPELSIVVLRFFNESGTQIQSIPTQRQIELYRLHLGAAANASGDGR